ncbi:virulence factor TspB C-terminal domain-related protein [Acinetobacter towneri]|uniref:virulence factor TspB C-terminal domain-related protein n=1 Tax=Acinetobacter towneri TaxID=202956 RepID=UPI002098074E|nr:hypothetical protein [Acinetobacter towneri]MCO8065949.1 hypothetical protein [Acinetobacter towneri]
MDLFYRYVLMLSFFITLNQSIYASSPATTAGSWNYTVTQDGSKKTNISGSKNITVNGQPKTLTSTIKDFKPKNGLIGRTMYRRLMAGTAGLGVAAVAGFLHTKGWYLDTLTGLYVIGANQKYVWTCGGIQHNSPASYASCMLGVLQQQNPTYDFAINTIENDKDQVRVVFDRTAVNNPDFKTTTVITGNGTVVTENEEVKPTTLTPQILDDILTNPAVNTQATAIPEALTPDVANGETPSTFEPYVDISTALDQQAVYPSQTDVTSTTTTTDTATGNQTTSTTNTAIPEFCNWATPICSFLDWFKDDSAIPEPEKYEVREFDKNKLPTSPEFNFRGNCPAPKTFNLNLGMASTQISLPYDYFCSFANDIRPFVILAAWLHACYIFVGFVRS